MLSSDRCLIKIVAAAAFYYTFSYYSQPCAVIREVSVYE